MPHVLQAVISILGRILLSAIFLMSVLGQKIPKFSGTAETMAAEGVPLPKLMLAGAIVFLLAGSLSVILGFWARIGSLLLVVFLVLASYFFHDFWTFEDPDQKQQQMIQFMKNLSMMGAMLVIMANGSGAGSLDRKLPAKQTEQST